MTILFHTQSYLYCPQCYTFVCEENCPCILFKVLSFIQKIDEQFLWHRSYVARMNQDNKDSTSVIRNTHKLSKAFWTHDNDGSLLLKHSGVSARSSAYLVIARLLSSKFHRHAFKKRWAWFFEYFGKFCCSSILKHFVSVISHLKLIQPLNKHINFIS